MATIGVVDDVAINRELLAVVLRARGHRVVEASDGLTALEMVRRERPDLVICDILMPGMDGYAFVRALRGDPQMAATPVVFCSAHYLEPEARQLARACGVREVLTKPVEPEHILRISAMVLAERGVLPVEPPSRPVEDFDQRHARLVNSKLLDKMAELERANKRLSSLVELNLQLASEYDKASLLDHVCRGACVLLGASVGIVAVRRADGEALAHVAHHGLSADAHARLDNVRLDRGVLGRVYREARVLHWAREDGGDPGLPAGHPLPQVLMAAPVKSLTAVYGWIALMRGEAEANSGGEVGNGERHAVHADPEDRRAHDRGGAPAAPSGTTVVEFSDADAELLAILAAQTGRIYENGSLYARLGDYARELEVEIAERERAQRHLSAQYEVARILNRAESLDAAAPELLAALGSQLGFGAATLWRVDEHDRVLRCAGAWCEPAAQCAAFLAQSPRLALTPGMGLPGTAWQRAAPIWSDDLLHDPLFLREQAALEAGLSVGGAVPIVVAGSVVGVLDVFGRNGEQLDAALTDTLSTLAGQIGQFFERAAQRQRIVRLTRVYAVLSGINAAIVRIHDRLALFREACRIAVDEGEFGIAWIGDVDRDNGEILPLAWAGVGDEIGRERLSSRAEEAAGQGAVGEAVRTGRPRFIHDLSVHQAVGLRRAEALRRGYRSLAALPLLVEERVVGVMVLYAAEVDFFTAEEQSLLAELANDISFALEYIAKQEMLAYLAYHDVLTGLPNRAHLLDRLDAALQSARLHPQEQVAVVLWDINRFRNLNDTFGRQVGDNILRELARRFRVAWPDGADVARITGDQFAGVIGGIREPTEIVHLLERTAMTALAEPVQVRGHALHLAVTAGIAVSAGPGEDADTLVRNAEVALRKAKRNGSPYLFYGPEMNARIAHALMLENRLRQAIERDEFVLHYQPKVCAASGRVAGLEALLRWHDPEDGLTQPAEFIPLLEETGLIVQVGMLAIRRALADARSWRAQGVNVPRIAVNVSALQLRQDDFVSALGEVLAAEAAAHGEAALDLEITESMLMTDLDAQVQRLSQLRAMGVEIAIDDFGTGYSSLGYLARLPVGALKIDRSFVSTMAERPESLTIVSTVVSLAHSLHLRVIAEGVEQDAHARLLREMGCDELQGYLISRPLPARSVPAFLAETDGRP
ncbi:MAG: EAL domain-containing protein [Rhodocyclaceae bacterium]